MSVTTALILVNACCFRRCFPTPLGWHLGLHSDVRASAVLLAAADTLYARCIERTAYLVPCLRSGSLAAMLNPPTANGSTQVYLSLVVLSLVVVVGAGDARPTVGSHQGVGAR
jgi:hypothetical protein